MDEFAIVNAAEICPVFNKNFLRSIVHSKIALIVVELIPSRPNERARRVEIGPASREQSLTVIPLCQPRSSIEAGSRRNRSSRHILPPFARVRAVLASTIFVHPAGSLAACGYFRWVPAGRLLFISTHEDFKRWV